MEEALKMTARKVYLPEQNHFGCSRLHVIYALICVAQTICNMGAADSNRWWLLCGLDLHGRVISTTAVYQLRGTVNRRNRRE